MTMKKRSPRSAIRKLNLAGCAIAVVALGGVGGWASTTRIAGAVVATGIVVVETSVKKVQHPTGGVVGEIRVRDGDRVTVGDLLIRLDETVTRANLHVITKQLDELAIRQARLGAERDREDSLQIPSTLAGRLSEPEVAAIVAGESTLFESRKEALAGQKSQLRERIAQFKEEIAGLMGQADAKAREIALVKIELDGVEKLWAKNLVSITKLTAMRREDARLDGERGQLVASAAQAKGKIAETELQIIQLDQEMRKEVMKDLREAQAKEAELFERKVAAEDQLKRIDIRAPQAGVVHQLSVHTIGGVITQAEPIMLIVPEDDSLVVEAKLSPQDIDHIRPGREAYIRFPAFNQRTTPEFEGQVTRVAADLTKDQQNNLAYYIARISIAEKDQARTEVMRLVPGMPAEVHIRTTERTALSYLMKPLFDQFALAFKER
jgi:membrane fusion protein, type I secretion system